MYGSSQPWLPVRAWEEDRGRATQHVHTSASANLPSLTTVAPKINTMRICGAHCHTDNHVCQRTMLVRSHHAKDILGAAIGCTLQMFLISYHIQRS